MKENNFKIQIVIKAIILFLLFFIIILIFAHKAQLTSLDLGRHIKNGEIIFQDTDVLFKNFYSYTETNFLFINHHWLSGVVFFLLFKIGGFKLLTVLNILLASGIVFLVFILSKKYSNFYLAALFSLPAVLMLSERTDIRPEMFSYLFFALTLYLVYLWRLKADKRILIFSIILQVVWINLHIYFFLGLFIWGLAFLEKIIIDNKKFFRVKANIELLCALALGSIASLFNPNHVRNFFYPFNILKEYGYEIVENKSPLYLENLMINYNIIFLKILICALIISFAVSIYARRKARVFDLFLSAVFIFLGLFAIRNIPLFAIAIAPIMARNFYDFKKNKYNFNYIKKYGGLTVLILYFLVGAWLFYDLNKEKNYLNHDFGFGLEDGSEESIKFFKKNNLAGPIFNNYDLGSALSFWLYPQEKVFVDNRPEAYTVDFFKNIYKPMQKDSERWEEYSKKYNINIIYFAHTDGTPWAKEFLTAMLFNKNWPLIYFDRYVIIMAIDNEANKNIITELRIDDNEFKKRFASLKNGANMGQLIDLASLASLAKKNDLAEEIYSELLEKIPDNEKILAMMGYLYSGKPYRSNQIKAISYFDKAIDHGYRLPSIYNQLGLVYWNLLDYNEAVKQWEKAIDINKKDDHAKYYLKQARELLR